MTTKRRAASNASRRAAAAARWADQRERLLQAARRAIHRLGPHVSMEQIAAEAGITKPIVYRHFGDRRGLARALSFAAIGISFDSSQEDVASARQALRERVLTFYPVVDDADRFRRVVVTWATQYHVFVETNRNLYRFLRSEGALGAIYDSPEGQESEPITESFAASLRAIHGARGIDDVTARVWALALRGMVREIVDWASGAHACDRFELERQFDLMTLALLSGLERELARRRRPAPKKRRRAPQAKRAVRRTPQAGRRRG
ncbi:MAG: helix-turn-helix domain-containing protein [Thermodesulfobacteriota bacterium]